MATIRAISKGQLRMQLHDLAGNAVAVYPAFRKVLHLNAATAQFLSQAVYWAERTEDGWFYKTEGEWQEEIGLSFKEVRSARKSLGVLGLLDENRKGVPAKMYFRVDTGLLLDYLSGEKAIPSCAPKVELVVPQRENKTSPKVTTSPSPKVELVVPLESDKCYPAGTTITENTQETTAEITSETLALLPAVAEQPKRVKKDAGADKERQDACRTVWQAYAQAYFARYSTDPVRNAKVNRQIVDLYKRLGAEAAPVASFFLSINDAYLIRNCHDLGSLLAKAESYRTQWATGRQMNGRTARQIEDTQANVNAAQEAARLIRERGEGGKRNAFL